MNHIGVDGCTAGWVAVGRASLGLNFRIFPRIVDLVAEFAGAERIFIDIPIGLPWAGEPTRPCDQMARDALGGRRSPSVFPVPCRDALAASNVGEAREINMVTLGRSLSEQTWNIMHKIAEVDALLQSSSAHRAHLREIHPEVCFWGLAGGTPMAEAKRTDAGEQARLQLLARYEPGITALMGRFRSDRPSGGVGADDILDAAAAFVTAEGRHGKFEALSGTPSHDLTGLPMEMVYLRV
ncbi:MAG: DUF429 domain-containing protein [Candidatus Eisenbacteria bacterium]